jgi:hypothetical protein
MEQVAHAAIAGQEGLLGAGFSDDAQLGTPARTERAVEQFGRRLEVQRPIVEGQQQQGHEERAQGESPRAPGPLFEQGLEARRHAGGIDHVDGEGDGLVAHVRGARRDGPAAAHARSEASLARSAALVAGAPST